jgi:hypothetical protein
MTNHIAVKAAPATTGNGLLGSDPSGKKIPDAHTEKVSQQQLAPASWRDVLPVHPAANLSPQWSHDALVELGKNINTNGLQVPLVLWAKTPKDAEDGKLYLLDGRSRLTAMEMAGIEVVKQGKLNISGICEIAENVRCVETRYGGDPYEIVLSLNVHRRHLTPEQKRDLIAKALKEKPELSNRQIAEQEKVSPHTVSATRAKLEATEQIAQLKKTVGKDGKLRPARKSAGSLNGSTPTAPNKSEKALAEFKYACQQYLPKMTTEHRSEAVTFVAGLVSS